MPANFDLIKNVEGLVELSNKFSFKYLKWKPGRGGACYILLSQFSFFFLSFLLVDDPCNFDDLRQNHFFIPHFHCGF